MSNLAKIWNGFIFTDSQLTSKNKKILIYLSPEIGHVTSRILLYSYDIF